MCMCVESALPSTPASLLKHSFLAVMTRKTFREQPYAVQGSVAAHRRENGNSTATRKASAMPVQLTYRWRRVLYCVAGMFMHSCTSQRLYVSFSFVPVPR